MRKIKNMLFAMLAVVMVLSMTACSFHVGDKSGNGDSGSGNTLVGTWGLDYDLSDIISDSIGEEFAGFSAPLELSIRLEFKENGTYSLYGDKESFTRNYDAWLDEFIAFSVDMMYEQFEEMGIDKAAADEQFEEIYGGSMEDYLRQFAEEEMDASALLEEMSMSGKYETSGDKLYMSETEDTDVDKDNYEVFTITGDTLKLDLPDGASAASIVDGFGYPLELKRVG